MKVKPTDSRLSNLRKKYVRLIDEKKAEIRQFESKLALLDELAKEAGFEDEPALPLNGGESKRYSGWGLSKAAVDALENLGRQQPQKGFGRGDVAQFLRDNGYIQIGKNFLASVDTALRRAAASGKITSVSEQGRRLYFPRQSG